MSKAGSKSKKLLLMGSSAFKAMEMPVEVKERIDDAMERGLTIIVGEASGANRLYQDYLNAKGYRNVVVGHAVKLRYNVGNWKDVQYGKDQRKGEEDDRGMRFRRSHMDEQQWRYS